ncbi:NUDIX domain-containing protein [Pyricularia oryzae]|nr:NUDIX domain-containing protein [Pyricularia oryzae]KAI7919666.1 NUDIX domain-containing protein [Pyricularia oryzae]
MATHTTDPELDSRPSETTFTDGELNSVIEATNEIISSTPAAVDLQIAEDVGSYYWDASTMGQLNKRSLAAIARLRAYQSPPFPLWDRLPATRRAAVLVLLYADRAGELRVVITMRSATLRNFSGQAAFPGGKADSVDESPYQIARREAWEEIGLPMDDSKIPAPFVIENLCYLPHSLARTGLVVRPCVAFLHPDPTKVDGSELPNVDETLIPRLDAKEVAAVFSAPFHNFLKAQDEGTGPVPSGQWYEGRWTDYNDYRWRLHYFYVPIDRQRVTRPKEREGGQAALAEPEESAPEVRFKVWGMTGRMLVDAARLAYGEEPEFEHNEDYGDEKMINELESQILETKL